MQFQRVNRSSAEKVFGVCQNVSGATISGNYPVCFTTAVGSADGYGVVLPLANSLTTFAGILDADLTDTSVGLYQCYGYRDSVRIFGHATSVSISADVPVGPGPSSAGVGTTGAFWSGGPVVTMESIGAVIRSAGGYAKGFIRAL